MLHLYLFWSIYDEAMHYYSVDSGFNSNFQWGDQFSLDIITANVEWNIMISPASLFWFRLWQSRDVFWLFCLHLFASLVYVLMAFLFRYGHWELVDIEIECFNFAPKVDMNPWRNSPPFKHPFDEQSVTCQVTTGFGNCKLPYHWTCCSHGRIGNQCHLVQRAPFRL